MRRINRKYRYNRYLSEAIPYSNVKKYLRINRSKEVQKRLDFIFNKLSKLKNATASKRGDRVYIPFEIGKRTSKSNIQLEIEALLINNGMELLDYSKGLALDKYGRKTKIGKLLRRLDKSLLQPFANDTSRVSDKIVSSYIVFSKHKYDIVGMSTGRNWTSCMDIYDGMNKEYVEMDIKYGTFVAYLVSSDDMNINNPFGRVNLKPFINSDDEDDIVYFSDKVYDSGNVPKDFKISIDKILSNIQKIDITKYTLKYDIYCDANRLRIGKLYNLKTKQDIESLLNVLNIRNYTINSDLSVDVDGDVKLVNMQLTQLPVKFNIVSGNFDCGYNTLTTLAGSPHTVGGKFSCYDNRLSTLAGSPKIVGGDFDCRNNKLSTLIYSPKTVGGSFDCSNNALTTLAGSPKTVGGSFDCNGNELTTLEGSPKSVGGNFICYYNRISTLIYSPKTVGGSFDCRLNIITTLEGSPKTVGGDFTCSDNKLTTLEGSPKTVGGDFTCSDNKLTTLEGSPKTVGGDFYAEENSKLFTKSDVLEVSEVKGNIYV